MDVQTVTLAPKPIPQTSEFVGTIRSLRSTTIQPQVEGFIRQILVKAGDRVRAGQALVQIDPDRQRAAATVTESQRGAREADLALAKQQLTRAQTLYEAGAVSRAALDEADATYKSAEAQLAALQSQIREDQVELRYYRVTAPTAGIVGEIASRQGDRVTSTTVITTIDQAEGLEVYINVPLEQASRVHLGLPVEIVDGDGKATASTAVSSCRWSP
jgi:RND family efflux transporter MFP subunit